MSTPSAHFLPATTIDAVLGSAGRVYLTGHLERPQASFPHISTLASAVELGITRHDVPAAEQPHLHERNTDIMVVQRGSYAVRILSTGASRVMGAGDVCVLEPNVPHVCVASAGSQVMFFKTPGGNDKVPVELDPPSAAWVEQQLRRFEAGQG